MAAAQGAAQERRAARETRPLTCLEERPARLRCMGVRLTALWQHLRCAPELIWKGRRSSCLQLSREDVASDSQQLCQQLLVRLAALQGAVTGLHRCVRALKMPACQPRPPRRPSARRAPQEYVRPRARGADGDVARALAARLAAAADGAAAAAVAAALAGHLEVVCLMPARGTTLPYPNPGPILTLSPALAGHLEVVGLTPASGSLSTKRTFAAWSGHLHACSSTQWRRVAAWSARWEALNGVPFLMAVHASSGGRGGVQTAQRRST
jgi:hypothetical protein